MNCYDHRRDPNLQFVEQPALQPPEFVINQADQQVRQMFHKELRVPVYFEVFSETVRGVDHRSACVRRFQCSCPA